jgi:hypothetical protein
MIIYKFYVFGFKFKSKMAVAVEEICLKMCSKTIYKEFSSVRKLSSSTKVYIFGGGHLGFQITFYTHKNITNYDILRDNLYTVSNC